MPQRYLQAPSNACGGNRCGRRAGGGDVIPWTKLTIFAPPKTPWNDDSPWKYEAMVSHGFKMVQHFVHSQFVMVNAQNHGVLLGVFLGESQRECVVDE